MIHSFTTTVQQKQQLTEDVILLKLTVPDDFMFVAGQFITLFIERDGQRKPRSYSILSPPKQKGSVDLCIKIVPDGYASTLFAETKVGDTFEAKAPFGHFVLQEGKHHCFLATGTGMVPFYSMIQEHINTQQTFSLYFGVRTEQDLFLDVELQELAKKQNFTYVPILSRQEWSGKTGHVQDHLPNAEQRIFYICGLKEFVLDTKEKLLDRGVPKERIKVERYS